jgi:outer membrane protein OmpA-like peptidoglycan-associated protein
MQRREGFKQMMKAGFGLCVAALAMAGITGCTTKNYVKKQTAPLIDRTNELEEKTQANNRSLHDVDDRAQAGIKQAQGAADSASQSAQNASKAAGDAETAANDAVHRADSLDSVVKGLDNYHQVGDVTVTFGFNKSNLTKDVKEQLDNFGQQLGNASNFILEVTGGTDSIGSANYNYALSDRRAGAVVQYLVSKYNVPPRRFYLIGMGKDIEVAPNNTAEGRQQNRRVQVRMLSNSGQQNASAPANPGSGQ